MPTNGSTFNLLHNGLCWYHHRNGTIKADPGAGTSFAGHTEMRLNHSEDRLLANMTGSVLTNLVKSDRMESFGRCAVW